MSSTTDPAGAPRERAQHHPDVTLRPASAGDVSAVADIWRLGWRDGHLGHVPQALVEARTAQSFLFRAAGRVQDTTVAEVGGRVVGFVMVRDDEVEQVYVSRDHRGTEVASALMDEAERLVRAGGHSRAWLAVVAGNARARRFYERRGWADEGLFDYAASDRDGAISVPAHRYVKAVS